MVDRVLAPPSLPRRRPHRLHIELALRSVSLAVVLGLILSLIQIGYDMLVERDRSRQQIEEIMHSVAKAAAEAAYELDPEYSMRVVEGLIRYDLIIQAAIYDDRQSPLAQIDQPPRQSWMEPVARMLVADHTHFELPLYQQRVESMVGQLTIEVDPVVLAEIFLHRAGFILVSGLIRNLSLAFLLVILFYVLLTRPLVRTITLLNRSLQSGSYVDEAAADFAMRDDELGQLVRGFQQLLQQQQQGASALEQALTHQDLLVQQRTQELQARLTELELTMAELVETKKMAALGQLVAGFAHEINTPIGIAVGASSHAISLQQKLLQLIEQDEVNEEDINALLIPQQQALQLTQESLDRAAQLVVRIKRVVSDHSKDEPHRFDLCATLPDLVATQHLSLMPAGVKVQLECAPGILLWAHVTDLVQLFSHLIENSIQHGFRAVGDGAKVITIKATQDENHITIRFSDNGRGMDAEVRDHLFEPFFTTSRGQFKSSGLGLYICYNIVTSQLQGTIRCDSQLGEGSTITITIPSQPKS